MTVKKTKIVDYTPDPANPNRHTQRGVSMLEDSLATVGLGRSIVVDKNGIVLAGNSTQQQAVDAGFENAIEVETTGDTMVVVRRTDLDLLSLDDTKARALSYFDNRAAEIGIEWDSERLLADVNAGIDFSRMFNEDELNALLSEINIDIQAPEDFKTYNEDIETAYCCPKCGYKWSGKPDSSHE